MTRDARTSLPPMAHDQAQARPVAQTPDGAGQEDDAARAASAEEKLAPEQVRLCDGRIATLRRTSRADDRRMERIMTQRGDALVGMGSVALQYNRALNALVSLGKEPVQPIMTPAQLDALENKLFSGDADRIMEAWARLNGMNPATFPQS